MAYQVAARNHGCCGRSATEGVAAVALHSRSTWALVPCAAV